MPTPKNPRLITELTSLAKTAAAATEDAVCIEAEVWFYPEHAKDQTKVQYSLWDGITNHHFDTLPGIKQYVESLTGRKTCTSQP